MVTLTHAMSTVTIQEAMAIVGVSRRTIYYWVAKGKLQTIREAGGRLRIVPESLFYQTPPDKPGRRRG